MVRFKCLLSGNIFQFKHEWDVAEMRKHPQYVELQEAPVVEKATTVVKKTAKKEK